MGPLGAIEGSRHKSKGAMPKMLTRQQTTWFEEQLNNIDIEISMNDSSFKTRIILIKSNTLSVSVVKKMLTEFEEKNQEFSTLVDRK